MSGPGCGKPGPSSGGGSSNGVGARTTSGSVTGIGWFACGIIGMDAWSILLNHAESNLSVMRQLWSQPFVPAAATAHFGCEAD
jgi:hypothetical protein